jgi:hypothetical protein
MPGIPRELAEHKLKVYPQARPIRQKLRRFTPDKREAIRAELARLVLEIALRCKLIQRGSVTTQTGFLLEMAIALLI